MEKVLLVNSDLCTGCKQCTLACSLIKEDLFDPARGRIKVMKKEDIALGLQLLCEQCEAHPCIGAHNLFSPSEDFVYVVNWYDDNAVTIPKDKVSWRNSDTS
ncbi:MAG: hypothetical protein DRP09_13885, partial [Candidatus Thorarchaeota archaeon]